MAKTIRPDIDVWRQDDGDRGIPSSVTMRRCPNGHGFHPKFSPCPECGDAPQFNKGLRTASLNRHLYDMAERA